MRIKITTVTGTQLRYPVMTTRTFEEIKTETSRLKARLDFDRREVIVRTERDMHTMESFLRNKLPP